MLSANNPQLIICIADPLRERKAPRPSPTDLIERIARIHPGQAESSREAHANSVVLVGLRPDMGERQFDPSTALVHQRELQPERYCIDRERNAEFAVTTR